MLPFKVCSDKQGYSYSLYISGTHGSSCHKEVPTYTLKFQLVLQAKTIPLGVAVYPKGSSVSVIWCEIQKHRTKLENGVVSCLLYM